MLFFSLRITPLFWLVLFILYQQSPSRALAPVCGAFVLSAKSLNIDLVRFRAFGRKEHFLLFQELFSKKALYSRIVEPMEFWISIKAVSNALYFNGQDKVAFWILFSVYDSGSVFKPDVLDIKDEDVRNRFMEVSNNLEVGTSLCLANTYCPLGRSGGQQSLV